MWSLPHKFSSPSVKNGECMFVYMLQNMPINADLETSTFYSSTSGNCWTILRWESLDHFTTFWPWKAQLCPCPWNGSVTGRHARSKTSSEVVAILLASFHRAYQVRWKSLGVHEIYDRVFNSYSTNSLFCLVLKQWAKKKKSKMSVRANLHFTSVLQIVYFGQL